jgi:hypothetical protein
MHPLRHAHVRAAALALAGWLAAAPAAADPERWQHEWPNTDFDRTSIDYDDVFSGGPPRDGIPSIDDPEFVALDAVADLPAMEPVVAVEIDGDRRAYPLRILMWHEIVNDVVGGVPVAVTFCPLCNSAVVFDRRVEGRVLAFGTTGKLRNSDLVMYDRQTESWWQQFLGEAIVGEMTGTRLAVLPARVESFARFRERALADGRAQAKVQVPNDATLRQYGRNPYAGYENEAWPFLYRGGFTDPVPPLSRVVVVDGEAWSLALLRDKREIVRDDLVISWTPGQAAALDAGRIAEGRDIGNVVVQRRRDGALTDVPYDVSFAFAFRAFHPNAPLHTE